MSPKEAINVLIVHIGNKDYFNAPFMVSLEMNTALSVLRNLAKANDNKEEVKTDGK